MVALTMYIFRTNEPNITHIQLNQPTEGLIWTKIAINPNTGDNTDSPETETDSSRSLLGLTVCLYFVELHP